MTEDSRISEIRAVVDGYDSGEFKDKLTAFDRIRAILDRPVSDDETKWEWGCGSALDEVFGFDEETARQGAEMTGTLRKRRLAGPWIEVQP